MRFSEWLQNELTERDMRPADLARKGRIGNSLISRLLSSERNPTPETLRAIAKAFRLPVDTVYRAAGLLPSKEDTDEAAEYLMHLYETMPPEGKKRLIHYAEFEHEQEQTQQENGNAQHRTKRKVQSIN